MAPSPDPNLGPVMVLVTSVTHAILLPLFAGRLYVRLFPDCRLSWDGYFLIAAVVFDLVQWVFLLLSIGHGYGHHPDYVSFPDFLPLAKYLFFSQPFSIWALSCAKISVACCLLRVQRGTTRPSSWRMFLFSLVGVQVIITAIINYFQFTRCRPIRAIWGEYAPDSQCVDDGTAQISIYVNLAMVAFTDLAFALLPLSMLRDRPPVHEKVAICSMVFVGFLATSATLAKMIFVHKFIVENLTVDGAGLTICTNLEIQFAIMAASIACLKRPLVRLLRSIGLVDKSALSQLGAAEGAV